MANTLAGINLAQIANETLKALMIEFHRFSIFTMDFSSDIATKGESVTTRVPSLLNTQDLSNGYEVVKQDVTSTAKVITLSQFEGIPIAFTDAEISKAGDENFLRSIFMDPVVEGTIEGVMDNLSALVVAGNFPDVDVITAANFDADDLADKSATLTTANVPRKGRYAMLNPTYFGSLVKDNSIQDSQAYGSSDPVQEHVAPRVHGFEVLEFSDVPDNSENLVGWVGTPDALLIAARQPATPAEFTGQLENIADPTTGLPLQFRFWYDESAGLTFISVAILYGTQVGNAASLSRITSA